MNFFGKWLVVKLLVLVHHLKSIFLVVVLLEVFFVLLRVPIAFPYDDVFPFCTLTLWSRIDLVNCQQQPNLSMRCFYPRKWSVRNRHPILRFQNYVFWNSIHLCRTELNWSLKIYLKLLYRLLQLFILFDQLFHVLFRFSLVNISDDILLTTSTDEVIRIKLTELKLREKFYKLMLSKDVTINSC